ncbi:MAG: pseudouridine synthase [bacterium]|nr:pseudouridine synthase [bacterium]
MILAFNKPFRVLSQFTPEPGSKHDTLASFGFPPNVYALGRLDADSEGLLLLSDEKGLNTRVLDPMHAHRRTYWAQVEGIATEDALKQLRAGVRIGSYTTMPCTARLIDTPDVFEREVPIRQRRTVPTSWVELELVEGKNRQVRRMLAAVELPVLRLLRVRIGDLMLDGLNVGTWRELDLRERGLLFR